MTYYPQLPKRKPVRMKKRKGKRGGKMLAAQLRCVRALLLG